MKTGNLLGCGVFVVSFDVADVTPQFFAVRDQSIQYLKRLRPPFRCHPDGAPMGQSLGDDLGEDHR